ncbi:hypothetical protein GPECTOR_33g548 [Gonium pectorale]|uniref:Uncharacterized protein n=1 Tax=Gonium pectorale TaxID=33097 RepID=A0A150GCU2_GONPE|nr:hypothetical protein GPECTOR_33g548 [Gonium pectorale]|eukprot:KXZ47666.1 hypothetical protein GPECTOR_33g548 [Gonium pectorale]
MPPCLSTVFPPTLVAAACAGTAAGAGTAAPAPPPPRPDAAPAAALQASVTDGAAADGAVACTTTTTTTGALGRVRVRLKLHSVHPEQLEPGTLAALGRLLLPSGWLLTSAAARRGCIELVLDYSRVDYFPAAGPTAGDGPGGSGGGGLGAGLWPGMGHGQPAAEAPEAPGVAGGGSVTLTEWQVADLVACLQERGVLEPRDEPLVSVQVDQHVHTVQWQWRQPWGPPVFGSAAPPLAAGLPAAAAAGERPGWAAWGSPPAPRGADAAGAPGSWRCAAVAVACPAAPAAAGALLAQPACVVVPCRAKAAAPAIAGAADAGLSSVDSGGGDSVVLQVCAPRGGAHGCSVRCLGRFLPTRELRRVPLLLEGCGPAAAESAAAASAAAAAGPLATGATFAPASQCCAPHEGSPAVEGAYGSPTATSVGACGAGDVLLVAVDKLPGHSALLQLEARAGAPTAPAAWQHEHAPRVAHGAVAEEAGAFGGYGSATASWCLNDLAAGAFSSTGAGGADADATAGLGPGPSSVLSAAAAAAPAVAVRGFAAERHRPQPCAAHVGPVPLVPLLAAAPVLLLRPCGCGAAAASGSRHPGDGADCGAGPEHELGGTWATGCRCGGVVTRDLAEAAALELCSLRARLTADAPDDAPDEANSGPGVQDAVAAASEFLFDLGLLLDAASCAGAVGAEPAAPPPPGCDGADAAAGAGGAVAGGPDSEGAAERVLDAVAQEVRQWLCDQMGLAAAAAGAAAAADGQPAATAALRQHFSDVSVTLLAGCAELGMGATAQLLVELAVSRLRLGGAEELLAAAADGDARLEARLPAAAGGPAASPAPAAGQALLRQGRPLRRAAAALLRQLGPQLAACFTGFPRPGMERAFWMDTACRMQVPVWLYLTLMATIEVPSVYILYRHLDGYGAGLLTSSVLGRLVAYAALKTAVTVGAQALRRLRFQARAAAAKAE